MFSDARKLRFQYIKCEINLYGVAICIDMHIYENIYINASVRRLENWIEILKLFILCAQL